MLDGEVTHVVRGDTIYVPAGCMHDLVNENDEWFELFFLYPSWSEMADSTGSGIAGYEPFADRE